MLNILTISWSRAHYLFDCSYNTGIVFIWVLCLMLSFLFIGMPAIFLDYDKQYYTDKAMLRTALLIFCTGVLLLLFSCRNVVDISHYEINYRVANAQRQMHHIKRIYPSLSSYNKFDSHTCTSPIVHDMYITSNAKRGRIVIHNGTTSITIHSNHQYHCAHQLTKSMARKKYNHYHNVYEHNKAYVKLPLGIHVHNKAKLYNLHWWNAI